MVDHWNVPKLKESKTKYLTKTNNERLIKIDYCTSSNSTSDFRNIL